MNKKIISAVLASAMAISTFGIVASAADEGIDSKVPLEAIAGLNTQKINAKVPAGIIAAINPYKAVITDETNGVADSFADGVVSPTYQVQNLDTNKGLNVSVTPSIKKTTLAVSEEPIADDVTEKTMFAWLNTTTLETAADTPLFADTSYKKTNSQVVFTEEGTTVENIMSIAKAPADGHSSGYFRIQGDLNSKLDEGESWTAKDTATFSIILDLAASNGEAKDVTLKNLIAKASGTELITANGGTSFDVKKADIAITGIKLTLNKPYPNETDATKSDTKVIVAVNGKITKATGSDPTVTSGVASYTCTADDFPTGYAPAEGDVITIILKNEDYTASYTINVIAG